MIYIDCVNHYFVTNEPIYYYYTPLLQRFAILANMEEMKEVKLKLFNPYEFLCMKASQGNCGAGSYGKVRCTYHQSFARSADSLGWTAAKCYPTNEGSNDENLVFQQIRRELEALQRVQHENILRVYGCTLWEGSIGLVTELMPGGNLGKLLFRYNRVPLGVVLRLRICADIASGMAAIHKNKDGKRLVHGDIKPENILLSGDLRCKIGDFGSALLVNLTGNTETADRGDQDTTVYYQAPERLQDPFCRVKTYHDTYSYGLVIHGVLTREIPNKGVIRDRYVDAIKDGKRPKTDHIDIFEMSVGGNSELELVEKLKETMESCWNQDKDKRPTMDVVFKVLHQLVGKQNPDHMSTAVDQVQKEYPFLNPGLKDQICHSLSSFNATTGKFPADASEEIVRCKESSKLSEVTMESEVLPNVCQMISENLASTVADGMKQRTAEEERIFLQGRNHSSDTVSAQNTQEKRTFLDYELPVKSTSQMLSSDRYEKETKDVPRSSSNDVTSLPDDKRSSASQREEKLDAIRLFFLVTLENDTQVLLTELLILGFGAYFGLTPMQQRQCRNESYTVFLTNVFDEIRQSKPDLTSEEVIHFFENVAMNRLLADELRCRLQTNFKHL